MNEGTAQLLDEIRVRKYAAEDALALSAGQSHADLCDLLQALVSDVNTLTLRVEEDDAEAARLRADSETLAKVKALVDGVGSDWNNVASALDSIEELFLEGDDDAAPTDGAGESEGR